MSQPRSKSKRKDPPSRDVRPYWAERGYRPEIAALPPQPNEDPKGEVAYQRAFAEAAKSDPPRLPNPQKYPNSESATTYMRQKDIDFTAVRGSKRYGDEQSTSQQNSRRLRDPDRSPLLATTKQHADTSPSSNFMPNPRLPAGAPMPSMSSIPPMSSWAPTPQTPAANPQPSFATPRLSVMEPYSGPSGPVNKLR